MRYIRGVIMAVLACLASLTVADPFCVQSSLCGQCIDDINYMSKSFGYRLSVSGNSIDASRHILLATITKMNGSVSSLNMHLSTQKNTILTALQARNTAVIGKLNILKVAILKHHPTTAAILKAIQSIHQTQSSLHISLAEVIKFTTQILNLIKNPNGIVHKVAQVNIAINDISQIIAAISKNVQVFGKIDQAINSIDKLTISLSSVSASSLSLKQMLASLIAIQYSIQQMVQQITSTQVAQFQQIQGVIALISSSNTDIYKNVTAHNSHLASLLTIIKQIESSIVAVNIQIAGLLSRTSALQLSISRINQQIDIAHQTFKEFLVHVNQISAYIVSLKDKTSINAATFTQIQIKLQSVTKKIEIFAATEKASLVQIHALLDGVIQLQKTNLKQLNVFIISVKSQVAELARVIIYNTQTLSGVSIKVASLKTVMNDALMLLKSLTSKCTGAGTVNDPCSYKCTRTVSPVCASNGQTYTNQCEMNKAACRMKTVLSVASHGICQYITTFTAPPPTPLPCNKPCPQTFSPVCGSDGNTYSSSCHLENYNCRTGSNIEVARPGSCTTAPPPTIVTVKNCFTPCPSHAFKVCGSDGKTYVGLCLLTRHNCIYGTSVTVVSYSACSTPPPLTTASSPCTQVCALVYKPVCGTNGKTYTNVCLLQKDSCTTGTMIIVAYLGACKVITLPPVTLKPCATFCSAVVDLVCGTDGKTYTNMCELHKHACIYQTLISAAYKGTCHVITLAPPVTPTPCTTFCAAVVHLICGTDGRTYTNPCELQKHACITMTVIAVAYVGACRVITLPPVTPTPCITFCAAVVDHVCGTDGRTYTNPCELQKHACVTHAALFVAYKGSCRVITLPPVTPCTTVCIAVVDSVCGTDGKTYTNLCELQKRACLTMTVITVAYKGACRAPTPPPPPPPTVTPNMCPTLPCPKIYDPVCGTDGLNYASACVLHNEGCAKGVTLKHKGQCVTPPPPTPSPTTPCPLVKCLATFNPVCGSDGITYENPCELLSKGCTAGVTKRNDGPCVGSCTSGFVTIPNIAGCFYVYRPVDVNSQDHAIEFCRKRNSVLIMFANDAEYAAVQTYIKAKMGVTRHGRNYWVTGRETGKGSVTAWTLYPFTNEFNTLTTSSWYKNRPKRQSTCATMYGSVHYKLVDVNCAKKRLSEKYGWICRI